MTLFRVLLCMTLTTFAGCGDDDTLADAAVAIDAAGSADVAVSDDAGGSADTGGSADAATDVGTSEDVGVDTGVRDAGMDAGPDVMDAGMPDTGSACETRVEDRIAGVCDGMGMQICTNWASENGGMNAVAQCVQTGGRCARADTCTDDGCMCGSEAECADTEMCVSGVAGFSCVCASPRL